MNDENSTCKKIKTNHTDTFVLDALVGDIGCLLVREYLDVQDLPAFLCTHRDLVSNAYMTHKRLLTRLASLFNNSTLAERVLSEIAKYAVIAGGSIVFAHNDFVPAKSVGDIDIFLRTTGDFLRCLDTIYAAFTVQELRETSTQNYEDGHFIPRHLSSMKIKPHKKEVTVVSVAVSGERLNFQLVFKVYLSPEHLISYFDLDYVQCYLHKGQFHRTTACALAHHTRRVNYLINMDNSTISRMLKAAAKGFKTPIFGVKEMLENENRILCKEDITQTTLSPYVDTSVQIQDDELFWIKPFPFLLSDFTFNIGKYGFMRCTHNDGDPAHTYYLHCVYCSVQIESVHPNNLQIRALLPNSTKPRTIFIHTQNDDRFAVGRAVDLLLESKTMSKFFVGSFIEHHGNGETIDLFVKTNE